MWWHIACEALNAGKCLEISYDGFRRVVEVHAVGTTSDGNPVMRAWQVRGGSKSGTTSGWKILSLEKTWSYSILDEDSLAPRPQYKRGDKAIAHIRCQI
jgi:hypothetical protein